MDGILGNWGGGVFPRLHETICFMALHTYALTTGAPMAPGNLRLGQEKNGSLILEWDRPTNMPDEVNIEYTITVRSMEESETSFETTFNTSALSHSFTLVNSTTCQLFLFTIRGRNSAGMGLVSTPIVDTVPICKLLFFFKIIMGSCTSCSSGRGKHQHGTECG